MKIRNKVVGLFRYLRYNQWGLVDRLIVSYAWWLPDELYIKTRFRAKMGVWPNLKNPRTFNEKINWLKLHNQRPEYTTMVDKLAVKEYVANIIGEEYVIPTLFVWNSLEEIEWEKLPQKFVLKTTHGGGGCGVVICHNKSSFDRQMAIEKLQTSMKSVAGRAFREYPYYKVSKRIIAEQILEIKNQDGGELKDYKFFCFNGIVRFFKIDFGRFVDHHANYYSPTGQLLPFGESDCPPVPKHVETIPDSLSQMIAIAEKLSAGMPFLRVDLYNVDGMIYFGEMTFFPAGGLGKFTPVESDCEIGQMFNLSLNTLNI